MILKPDHQVLDVLALFKQLKEDSSSEKNFESKLSDFEKAFKFQFKITIQMKRIIREILQRKGYTFRETTSRNPSGNGPEVVNFSIMNVEKVNLMYDKYTIFSKKTLFLHVQLSNVATIEYFEDRNKCFFNIYNYDYYGTMLKLSKNINEYSDLEVVVSAQASKSEYVTLHKDDVDERNKTGGGIAERGLTLVPSELLNKVNVAEKMERINYYNNREGSYER